VLLFRSSTFVLDSSFEFRSSNLTPMIATAVDILKSGGLVAFATETVYGLGADATNSSAIRKIFAVKGRPLTNPLIVHLADEAVARRYVRTWPEAAERLARQFWPGPLTLVLPKSPAIVSEVSAGRDTIGIRVPNHPMALELLRAFDGPVAAPSANRANHISPTSAEDVRAELGDAVDLILDGGPCTIGIESTVLDLSTEKPCILRPGGVSREQIEAVIGPVEMFQGSVESETPAISPGEHRRHYSPISPAIRFERPQRNDILRRLQNGEPIAVVLVGGEAKVYSKKITQMPDDPTKYARALYRTLRDLDEDRPDAIYLEMPPDEPRWTAVRDRLRRATGS
jgi:L-threonylcarbamoyladenylate synthase